MSSRAWLRSAAPHRSSAPKVWGSPLFIMALPPFGPLLRPVFGFAVQKIKLSPAPSNLCCYKMFLAVWLRYVITYLGLSLNRLYTIRMGESIYSREYKLFIERLRKVRLEAGLTQVQAARKLKKPQSYVSKIERGERRIDVVELKWMLKIYKTELRKFF